MAALRAGAALPLTGRYGPMARDSAAGLAAWASDADVELDIVDCGDAPQGAAVASRELAGRVDILFGPYGSGATRAVAEAFDGRREVIWNHGGADVARTGARIVDVLGPASGYWDGLAAALAATGRDGGVIVACGASSFGRAVAGGAVAALRAAGREPSQIVDLAGPGVAGRIAATVRDGRVDAVVAGGRWEEEIPLGRALVGLDVTAGLVALGVAAGWEAFDGHAVGWIGPCQWLRDETTPPQLRPGMDYPAAQAFAAGTLAMRAIARAGGTDHDAVWDAARSMRTSSVLGPFAIDAEGRQVAHRAMIVRWDVTSAGPRRRVIWRPPQ